MSPFYTIDWWYMQLFVEGDNADVNCIFVDFPLNIDSMNDEQLLLYIGVFLLTKKKGVAISLIEKIVNEVLVLNRLTN